MTTEPVLDIYLVEIRRVRAPGAGTAETSYDPAVALPLDAVGAKSKLRLQRRGLDPPID